MAYNDFDSGDEEGTYFSAQELKREIEGAVWTGVAIGVIGTVVIEVSLYYFWPVFMH